MVEIDSVSPPGISNIWRYPVAEPEIFSTIRRFGTVLENVVLDPATREPDVDDGSLTENTRACYPLDFIPNVDLTGMAPHPANVIMLTITSRMTAASSRRTMNAATGIVAGALRAGRRRLHLPSSRCR